MLCGSIIMENKLLLAIFFLIAFLSPAPVFAATHSVCKSGCTYTSIQSAISTAQPGDIVEVATGTYSESITIPKDGTPNAWITLRAKPGSVVWIDSSSLNKSNIIIGSHSYWKIEGLKMKGAALNSSSGTDPGSASDGVYVGQGGHDIILQNLTIEAPNGDGIDLRGANYNIQILDNEIYDMRKQKPNYSGDGHGIHVIQQRGVSPSHDILVKGNFVHDSHGKACIGLADFSALNATHPTNIVVEYNKIQDCTMGIKINADGIFRHNLLIDTGKYTSNPEKNVNGFQAFTHDNENNVRLAQVYNNTVVGFNTSYSFDMRENGTSTPPQTFTIFEKNIAYNPRTYFIKVRDTNFTNSSYNLFYKSNGSASYIGYTPDSTSITNTDPKLNPVTFAPLSGSSVCSPNIGALPCGGTIASPLPSPTIQPVRPGDANNDNKIDGIDYVIWLNHYNQSVSGPSNGDFNNSGKVDGVDYVIWLDHYGK